MAAIRFRRRVANLAAIEAGVARRGAGGQIARSYTHYSGQCFAWMPGRRRTSSPKLHTLLRCFVSVPGPRGSVRAQPPRAETSSGRHQWILWPCRSTACELSIECVSHDLSRRPTTSFLRDRKYQAWLRTSVEGHDKYVYAAHRDAMEAENATSRGESGQKMKKMCDILLATM